MSNYKNVALKTKCSPEVVDRLVGVPREWPDGWADIVFEMDQMVRCDPNFGRWSQIKEKFGTLRAYYSLRDENLNPSSEPYWVHAIVSKYEKLSAVTCMSCGAPCVRGRHVCEDCLNVYVGHLR